MAKITVAGTKRLMNNRVEITFDIRTSQGKLLVPITVGDHGNSAANEKASRQDLRIWLQEALQELDALEARERP
jgi:hypothetical protein